jgi:hypothetical protein
VYTGEWSLHYGFLDERPCFVAKDNREAKISFQVTIKVIKDVWLFSDGDKSVHECEALVELNVDPVRFAAYSVSGAATSWPNRAVNNEGALILQTLPEGTHVITLVKKADKTARLTHVVTWE